jgi:hypothetical protein
MLQLLVACLFFADGKEEGPFSSPQTHIATNNRRAKVTLTKLGTSEPVLLCVIPFNPTREKQTQQQNAQT